MAETCYRHPDRETGVSCSSCGRPICPDCMTPTPVGMRCPECASQRTKVVQGVGRPEGFALTPATYVLIAINVVVYLIQIATGSGGLSSGGITQFVADFALFGPSVAEGEWYRLVTSGFLHASIIHIGFNMFLLLILGRLLEPALGTPRFLAVYFASMLAGSFGALVVEPNAVTIGASGAVFGLAAAVFVIARGRGMDAIASEIGFLILFNLVLGFVVPRISVGGHVGGLIGGALCALVIVAGEKGRLGPNRLPLELLAIAGIGIASVVGAVSVV
ncbi:MAG TPA: rhomboid family intramembrane serine protease [Solirubrobacterales bacterium]|nr:rhomboid family intramembrane serine protease [Solirubrobacterales bacterium]